MWIVASERWNIQRVHFIWKYSNNIYSNEIIFDNCEILFYDLPENIWLNQILSAGVFQSILTWNNVEYGFLVINIIPVVGIIFVFFNIVSPSTFIYPLNILFHIISLTHFISFWTSLILLCRGVPSFTWKFVQD